MDSVFAKKEKVGFTTYRAPAPLVFSSPLRLKDCDAVNVGGAKIPKTKHEVYFKEQKNLQRQDQNTASGLTTQVFHFKWPQGSVINLGQGTVPELPSQFPYNYPILALEIYILDRQEVAFLVMDAKNCGKYKTLGQPTLFLASNGYCTGDLPPVVTVFVL